MTTAERLIELAENVLHPRAVVVQMPPENAAVPYDAAYWGKVKLALDFAGKSAGLRLRAILESWDQQRIVKEVY